MTLAPVRRAGLGANRTMEQLVARRRSQKRNEPYGDRDPLGSGTSASRPAVDGILRDAREPGEFASRYPGGTQLCLQRGRCFGVGLGRTCGNALGLQGRDAGLDGIEHCQGC